MILNEHKSKESIKPCSDSKQIFQPLQMNNNEVEPFVRIREFLNPRGPQKPLFIYMLEKR